MAKVFISYRRADSAATSGRIYDRLVQRFKKQNVFKDVDNIPAGVRFGDYILDALRQCSVVLVIMGRGWLTASADDGSRRLDDPADFVRVEIETALSLGLTVIPVLVEGASIPAAASLPESLRDLVQINAVEVRNDPDFTRDIERVVEALERILAQRGRRAPTAPRLLRPSAPPALPLDESAAVEPTASQVESSSSAIETTATVAEPTLRPVPQPARPSQPTRARWRVLVLPALALVLVAGSLGVLLTQKLAGDAAAATAAQQTRTANTHATGTAQVKASATTQQLLVQATQTATALLVHFPYRAPAPGPACDKDNAPWTLTNGTSQSGLACSSTHTRFSGTNSQVIWIATPSSGPFPQSYTMSVQVSNMSANGTVQLSFNLVEAISYFAGGLTISSKCIAQCSAGDTYNVNPAGTHTLSLSVKGTHVTFAVDGHAFSLDTAQGPIVTNSIGLRMDSSGSQSASADFSNFTITPIA